jgi:putative hemolysin
MVIAVAVLLFLMLLNGVFAMAELAMMTARQARLQQAAAAGHKGAATALALAREPTRFLSTVQVGITLIGILAGAFGEKAIASRIQEIIARVPVLAPHADTIALTIVVLLITYVSLVVGELVPKRIALAFPEAIASTISRPLAFLSVVGAWPIRFLSFSTGDDVSEEDVRALVARGASTGVFTPQEHTIFKRLLRLGDLTVYDLMVPRPAIVWIREDATPEAIRVLVGTSPFTHFPVSRAGIEEVIGVVHVKDLIAYGLLAGGEFGVMDIAHKPLFVPNTMPALKLLDQFKATKVHVAFVVDEHGNVGGMLTLTDLVAALLGDVTRRGEPAPAKATRREDGSWLLDGRVPMMDVVGTLGLPPGTGEAVGVGTIAGLLLAELRHIPREGEHIEWQGWRLEVVDMDGARIDKVLAVRLNAAAARPGPTS